MSPSNTLYSCIALQTLNLRAWIYMHSYMNNSYVKLTLENISNTKYTWMNLQIPYMRSYLL